MTESKATAKKKTTITRITASANIKDFTETLEITRTLFKDKVSKTSIVETSLACACASSESFTVSQLTQFIMKNLNVQDCFHAKDSNKSGDVRRATALRIRRHVVATLKTNHKADTLYAYDKATDSIVFTPKYRELCLENKSYRKRVSALILKVKEQYHAPKTVAKKATAKKTTAKKTTAKKTTTKKKAVKTIEPRMFGPHELPKMIGPVEPEKKTA